MEISVQNKATYESLRCFFNKENSHFLVEPKLLPCCGALACLTCIKNSLENSKFNCALCRLENVEVADFQQLASAQSLIDRISKKNLGEEIDAEIKAHVSQIKGDLNNRSELIEQVYGEIKQDITKRVAAVKDQLDTLHQELNTSLDRIKTKARVELESLNQQAETTVRSSDAFREFFNKLLGEFDENKNRIELELYQCQNYVDDLTSLDEKFRRILRSVIFEPSDWLPDETFILADYKKFDLVTDQTKQ